MAEMKDMYKVARYVDSDSYHDSLPKNATPAAALNDGSERYSKKRRFLRRKLSLRTASYDLENAVKHKYVEVRGDPNTGHWLKVTPGRGMQLVAKTWFGYRSGLVEQTMKEYKRSKDVYLRTTLIIVGVIASIASAVGTAVILHALKIRP